MLAKSPVNVIHKCPQVFGILEAPREETTTISSFIRAITTDEHSLSDGCREGHQGTWATEVFTCLKMDEGWGKRGGPQKGTRNLDSNPDSATFSLKKSKGSVSPPEWLVIPMVPITCDLYIAVWRRGAGYIAVTEATKWRKGLVEITV